ncbi:MAG: heme ABC transporter ATP-binding protein [Halioglobus sp.]|nr:heme ABC transporter ATP-binding protein [Halioglobus sp.]
MSLPGARTAARGARAVPDQQLESAATVLDLQRVSAAPWGAALLQDISVTLRAGDILALAGPNGAGKSSLLRLMAGDIAPCGGSLQLAGQPLESWPARERAQRLAVLPQLSLLNFPYTVEEVILLGRTPHDSGRDVDRRVLEQVLQLTGTAALRQRLYTRLSGGEKQRTQLARVFAQVWDAQSMAGRLLLLDEPTSALDLAHQQQVLWAIDQLASRGCGIVLAIHDLNLAAASAARVLVLDGGRQVALGAPRDVFSPALFREVFHVDVTLGAHPQHGHPLVIPQAAGQR